MADPVVTAYAKLNLKLMPMERGDRFEDPLIEAFAGNGFGEVAGGGTMQTPEGEIEFCGLDIDFFDLERGVPFVCQFLESAGATRGSELQYQVNGRDHRVPFGTHEGLALHVNGTELPDEVYQTCDINYVIETINTLLGDGGQILGHWENPRWTVLYVYGPSFAEMHAAIRAFLEQYPLCAKSRVQQIA